jgi:hypothetical protein
LRENGYRPIQIWVPDTRIPEFIAECRKQSQQIKDDPQEKEILGWIGNTTNVTCNLTYLNYYLFQNTFAENPGNVALAK